MTNSRARKIKEAALFVIYLIGVYIWLKLANGESWAALSIFWPVIVLFGIPIALIMLAIGLLHIMLIQLSVWIQ